MSKRLTFQEWKDGDGSLHCFPEVDGEVAFHANDDYIAHLEAENEKINKINDIHRKNWLVSIGKIEKLREALEFYGDHNNWQDIRDNCNINFQTITNEDDFIYGNVGQIYCGEIAREALNENK